MIRRNIPNTITLLNLLSGLTGIIFVFRGMTDYAIYMILLASVFDFLDGMSARMLKAYSEIGKSLDSLSDLVSFGVLPGLMVYSIAVQSLNINKFDYLAYIALIIPVFSAIRLAVFNNDQRQKENFRGLPVPANAIFIAALVKIFWFEPDSFLQISPVLFLSLSLLSGTLQIIFLPFLSLKFKTFGLKENLSRYLVIFVSFLLIVLLRWEGLLLTIPFYIAVSAFGKK